MISGNYHESVMIGEVIENLHINTGSQYIDATLGTGGHALEILKAGGKVLGIEMDPEMLVIAQKRIPEGNFVLGNFIDIDKIAKENNFTNISGIIFDLGVSNIHLTEDLRGFSFSNSDTVLDMRLNPEVQGVRATDLLNALREDQLIELFAVAMPRGGSKWLARRVINARPIATVGDFLGVIGELRTKPGLNAATLPFLALRIAVNSELDNLKEALPRAFNLLSRGGRMIIVSFHSGEDSIAKEFMKSKLILPSKEEISANSRSRSAKMRVYEKI